MKTVEERVREAHQHLVVAMDWTLKAQESMGDVSRLYAEKYADAEIRHAMILLDACWQRCAKCQDKIWIDDMTLDLDLCMGCHRSETLADIPTLYSQDASPL